MDTFQRALNRALRLRDELYPEVVLSSVIGEFPKETLDSFECECLTSWTHDGMGSCGLDVLSSAILDSGGVEYVVSIYGRSTSGDTHDVYQVLFRFHEICEMISKDLGSSVPGDSSFVTCLEIHNSRRLPRKFCRINSKLNQAIPGIQADSDGVFGSRPVTGPRWSMCENLLEGLQHLSRFVESTPIFKGLKPTTRQCAERVWHSNGRSLGFDEIKDDHAADPVSDNTAKHIQAEFNRLNAGLFEMSLAGRQFSIRKISVKK